MKIRSLILALGACAICAFAEGLPDLTSFKPLPKVSALPVVVEDFNSGWDGWVDQTQNFKWDAHAGMTGTGCLVAERKQSAESVSAYKVIELEHGVHHRLRLHYRTEMVEDPKLDTEEIVCLRFRNSVNGKIDQGSFSAKKTRGAAPTGRSGRMSLPSRKTMTDRSGSIC